MCDNGQVLTVFDQETSMERFKEYPYYCSPIQKLLWLLRYKGAKHMKDE